MSESSLAELLRARGLRLERLGLVTHTHLSHGSPTDHAAGEDQHVHLVCRECGAIDEMASELLRPLADQSAAERGFRVDIGHVSFFGLCERCGDGNGGQK
ncbi:Fur family transcriptional regulator [Micromonospora craniellae]|uniref:Fur family transcriptional regulator n=1 Tax=Micromonospora craniellae TaxID=2294034 RepID=UPI001CC35458|nr:transcriptional repressor [Micromonospora craniellae]